MAKLDIKLKVAGDEGDATKKNMMIKCPICYKEFTCGKAYGGHKRVHTFKTNKKKATEVIDLIIDDSLPRYTKCSKCYRTFRTKKSFEEHMENHQRSREFKDVKPTTSENVPSSSSTILIPEEEDHVDMEIGEKRKFCDLSRDLPPTWSRTGRRGQNSRAIICLPSSEDVYQGADALLVLSRGDARVEILPPAPEEMSITDADLKGKGKIVEFAENAGGDHMVLQKPSVGYICDQCNKSFNSYQALGGHNSHHKKAVETGFITEFSDSDDHSSSASQSEESVHARLKYRCPVCHKGFRKSQGLGAHRRRCKGLAPLTRVVFQEEVKEATVEVPQRTYSFDLNKLPPPEDQEEMEGINMLQRPEKILRLTWHDAEECPAS